MHSFYTRPSAFHSKSSTALLLGYLAISTTVPFFLSYKETNSNAIGNQLLKARYQLDHYSPSYELKSGQVTISYTGCCSVACVHCFAKSAILFAILFVFIFKVYLF